MPLWSRCCRSYREKVSNEPIPNIPDNPRCTKRTLRLNPRTADAGTPSAEPETRENTTATASFSRPCSCSAIPMRARSRGSVISSFHCLMREPVDTIPPAVRLSAGASSSVCNEGLTESSWTYHGMYPGRPHRHMSVLRPEEPMG